MNLPIKIKGGEIRQVRLDLLQKQGGKCAICHVDCPEDEAVLDHCHKGGQVRAVLHRGCNALLGRVENNAPRHGLKLEQLIAFLAGASTYIDLHRENVSGIIHPSHFTKEEKLEKKRAKSAALKAKKLRDKLKAAKLKKKLDDAAKHAATKPKAPERLSGSD